MARAVEMVPHIDEVLTPIQRDLFGLGALLATPDRDKMREQLGRRIDEGRIAELENAIDAGERRARALAGLHPTRRHAKGGRLARRAHGVGAPSGAWSHWPRPMRKCRRW
jgi:hypothetical protein